jgi:hypothetical protein
MEKALIHKSDGTTEVVEFQIGDSYRFLSDAVGGLIELVHLAPTLDMWVNENFIAEAEEKDLKVNAVATAMYSANADGFYPILGNVVFTGGTDDEGDTVGLTEDTLGRLRLIIEKSAPLIEKLNAQRAK